MTFSAKLEVVGMNKTDLARQLGISRSATTKWGEDCPKYVDAYLDALILVKKLQVDLMECQTAVRVMTQTTKGSS